MNPSVLFLDHSGSLGGAELYLLDVVRDLPGRIEVAVLQEGPFVERLREEGVDVEVIPAPAAMLDVQRETTFWSSLLSIPAVLATVVKVARRLQSFDVLYANSQKALIVGGVAGLLARKPVIWNLHDMLTADHFSDFNRRLAIQWSHWFVDRIITNSKATAHAFERSGGDGSKVHVVYNGIDPGPIDGVAREDAARLRAEFDLEGKPVVGVFSRLAPWKGQHVLLQALADLPDVHALLVGDTIFQPDVEYAGELHAMVVSKGLGDRVHFLGFRDDVPRLMKMVDVIAHTSVAPEPFGRVIVEGMLARRPVVATNGGGAREIVRHRENGILVAPGNATELRDAIQYLLSEGRTVEEMIERADRHAREHFSVTGMRRSIWSQVQSVTNNLS